MAALADSLRRPAPLFGVLPAPLLPPAATGHLAATADADFDRGGSCNGPPLHATRRHYASLHNSRCESEQPLCARKAPARFEPAYPRVSMCRMSAPPDPDAEERTRVHGLRGFPDLYNVESMRAGGAGAVVSPLASKLPRVIKVVDPLSATGALMRFRRGIEGDFLKHRNVSALRRFPTGPRDPDLVVEQLRGGLGYSKPADGLSRGVEKSDKFFTEKPQRWFADPSGRAVKVVMVGAPATAKEAAPYKSQLDANRSAMQQSRSQARTASASAMPR